MDLTDDPFVIRDIAKKIRLDSLKMVYEAGSGHIGGSFSIAEILSVLFNNVMNHNSINPFDSKRDRFILSKGHATPAYYSVLARSGYFPVEELSSFRKLGSRLQGHPDKLRFPMLETSSGSLGQGLSIAAGMAFGLHLDNQNSNNDKTNSSTNPKVFCMLGDGELDEGQIWESLATIKKYNLNNLITIIDHNKIQLDGTNSEVKNLEPLKEKFTAFNHYVLEVNGHDIAELMEIFKEAKKVSDAGNTVIIIAHTIKGKGVSFMENTAEWHGKAPNKEQYENALRELEENKL